MSDRLWSILPSFMGGGSRARHNSYFAFQGLPPYPTHNQQKLISKTWKLIEFEATKLGINVFVGMFERYPEVQNSFAKFANLDKTALSSNVMLHAHSLHVMHMIGRLVALLAEPENMFSTLVELGQRHQTRSTTDELLQYFCPAYVEALANRGNWKKETIKAWDTFFQFIRAGMIHGLAKATTPGASQSHRNANSEEHESSKMRPRTVFLTEEF